MKKFETTKTAKEFKQYAIQFAKEIGASKLQMRRHDGCIHAIIADADCNKIAILTRFTSNNRVIGFIH